MEEEASTASASAEPLLRPSRGSPEQAARPSRLAAILGGAAGRRGPSMLVREAAALHLEERRAEWAYSRVVVTLDVAWNMAFAVAAAAVLSVTVRERPTAPLRIWITGYALQCAIHVALVLAEYRRRRTATERRGLEEAAASPAIGWGGSGRRRERTAGRMRRKRREQQAREGAESKQQLILNNFSKRCESINTMASILWWLIGFYWVVSGGEALVQNAPRLYWLTVVFLAFDVCFAIFCVALACVIGIALCCCLPCIIAILYAVVGQEGASDADISILPRYRYAEPSENGQKTSDEGVMIPIPDSTGTSRRQRILPREDAECCICLTPYEDGVEIHAFPCNHHFHSTCIVKWLRINAICPLCKYNILKGTDG
ncbi:E3 ubiquitin protein ligase RIE1 [Ananas comosus]|uniref:RING-type E3 ubiquitin transferase n=1 Tax=Ananas comosus TaxID=4615 RepID=A0A199UYD4_ANACO|nr:E3 ubiquitin protein ligase RIE1 [Ananas comosus]